MKGTQNKRNCLNIEEVFCSGEALWPVGRYSNKFGAKEQMWATGLDSPRWGEVLCSEPTQHETLSQQLSSDTFCCSVSVGS